MPIGPSWLTSWVKTNSKHVVYKPDEKNKSDKSAPTTATTTSTVNSSTGSDDRHRRDRDDPRSLAVRNVNSRKHRRRLMKTRSATDMIVEMANARDSSSIKVEAALEDTSVSKHTISDSTEVTETESSGDQSPIQLVAGLFGASLEGDDSMQPVQLPPYQPKYLNEAASILQRGSPVQKQKKSHDSESSSVADRDSPVAPRKSHEESLGLTRGHDSQQHLGGLANLKFLPQPFFGRAEAEVQHTAYHESLDGQLVAALDDLEYMRGVALSNEYTCRSCLSGESPSAEKQPAALRSRGSAYASLTEASKQLNEVVSRHKKEVEQMTKERVSLSQIEPSCVMTMSHFAILSHMLTFFFFLNSAFGSKTFIASSTSLPTCAKI
jgi:hypothetical protein